MVLLLLTFCLLLLPLWESVIVLNVVLYVHSSIAIILMGKRELVALLNLSSWCLVMVERLFLTVPWGCLRFVIVVFPDHTHLLFLILIVKSDIIIIVMNIDKKISFYLKFTKTRKIDAFQACPSDLNLLI